MNVSRVLNARSVWKGPFFVTFPNLAENIKQNVPIKTKVRSCTIMPNMVGAKFLVHNGKEYKPVDITEEMIGRKLDLNQQLKPRSYLEASACPPPPIYPVPSLTSSTIAGPPPFFDKVGVLHR
ncbi:putative ribosomal protein S19, mitochondrial [Smittium mucronatum]|uniref:Putative ribosomal protein S19, mitochondrial n=1 Tax=Smittium mucronatum TaxID=133383 RepID=A0A1R0H7W2_9FUNG|nr:putative ribosomal protein S19, mitochondrial [Smittium mucronatum]